MKKLKLFFACLLMAVLSIGQVWAETATLQITSGVTANKNLTDNASNTWAVSSDGSYTSNNSYIQCGTNQKAVTYIRLTTSAFSEYKITKVQVWGTSKANTNVSAKVIIGGTTIGTSSVYTTQNASSGGTEFSVNNTNEVKGDLTIEISRPSSANGAIYFNKAIVTYEEDGGDVVIVKTLKSIAISGQTTVYEQFDSFSFDGTCTATYSVTENDVAQDDEEKVVTPTSVTTPDMTSAGEKEITVSFTDGDVTKTVSYNINVVAATKSSLIFTEACGGSGTADDDVAWTVVSDADESNFDSNRGIHYGTGTKAVEYIELTSAAFSEKITKIKVEAAGANTPSISVTVGGTTFGETVTGLTNSNVKYTIEPTNEQSSIDYTGAVVVRIAKSSSATGALYVKSVVVYYISDGKEAAGLAFDAAQKLAKVGGTLTAPTLSTADGFDGTVTYASSDEAVVKVNASTGAITEIVAAGKAVITAHSDATENFKEGSASYTIFVAEQAGTAEDPLTEASAKAVIDLGCTLSAYVKGTVASAHTMTSAGQVTVVLAGGMQFFHMLNVGGAAFTTETLPEFTAGDVVTAVGGLFKYNNSTYELEENCQMVERVPYETPKQSIANTKETAYTVAQALEFAADPVTYDITESVYIAGVVYDVKSFNSNNGTYDIYIKDAGAENKFEFRTCTGLYDADLDAVVPFDEGDVQIGDEVIGYGVMYYYNQGSIWQFNQGGNYLVSLNRPTIAVTGVELNKESTSLEVGETETLVATVAPENATNKAVTWASDDETVATVDENGVVTAVAEGTTTITVTTVDGSFTNDCEVTVTAADPTKHVVTFDATEDYTSEDTELSITKSNVTIAITDGNGRFNNQTDYRPWKNAEFTVSCSAGNITKIEFTCTAGNTVTGFADVAGLDKANSVWTGNAESVSFTASNAQVRIEQLVITYKEDTRDAAGLAWDPADDIEITVGETFSAPALVKPNDITVANITIASNNPDLATVSEGVVSLVENATGEATITATFTGDENYKPATISYNITVNEAGLDNVTFDATVDVAGTNEKSITKAGFTLAFTDGALDNGENYRLYKSNTMTLSSTDYLIKKIEFTCTTDKPITGFDDAAGLDKENEEWTGESNTVELTASNAQVRMTKIKVFYVEDTRAAAGLAWDPADDIELTVGDAFSAPALYNPNNIAENLISITSSNESVATVSEGEVSLVADATGTTTITATFAGNDNYKPATVSYKIKVNPAHSIYVQPSLNVNFGSVNQDAVVADKSITVTLTGVDAATLTLEGAGASAFTISPAAALTASGDITISASSANLGTFAATLTISDDAGNAESKVVNISITVNEVVTPETPVDPTSKWVPATAIEDGMEVLITGVKNDNVYAMGGQNNNNRAAVAGTLNEGVFTPGENTMAFTLVAQGDGTYAIRTSNGKYLYAAASGNNHLKTQDEVDENAKWTMTVASASAEGSSNRHVMQFNTGSTLFSCYASAGGSGMAAIALYVPKQDTPEPPTPVYEIVRTGLTAGNYYTLCYPKAMIAIRGGSLWSFVGKDASMAYIQEAVAPFEAGHPYLIYAESDKLEAVLEGDNANAAGNENGLYGTLEEMTNEELLAAGATYMLQNNALHPIGNGYLLAQRAYVKLGEIPEVNAAPVPAPGRKVRSMPMEGQTATGMEALNASEAPVKMIINGELFILRGEKMYNANGALVK